MSKTVGLFFGSFNPIHVGHMILANHLTQNTDLDEVWMVVSPHNPHKKKANLLEDHHRLAMVRIACEDNPKLKDSDIEFNLPKPSYTVFTLQKLKEDYPDHTFVLIMGEDNLRSFHKWKNYEYILDNYDIYVYPRVLTVQELDQESREENTLVLHQRVHLLKDVPMMKISSSFIRKSIAGKKDVKYLLTEKVHGYLDEMNFYK